MRATKRNKPVAKSTDPVLYFLVPDDLSHNDLASEIETAMTRGFFDLSINGLQRSILDASNVHDTVKLKVVECKVVGTFDYTPKYTAY
jgi:hypothetical protein